MNPRLLRSTTTYSGIKKQFNVRTRIPCTLSICRKPRHPGPFVIFTFAFNLMIQCLPRWGVWSRMESHEPTARPICTVCRASAVRGRPWTCCARLAFSTRSISLGLTDVEAVSPSHPTDGLLTTSECIARSHITQQSSATPKPSETNQRA
ncbi:hypothetical protein LZ30DRAFT_271187 [Colletotrichum cereale]|nr:hypothetical protein LZ30DRAFT_271187 [Colletotrichum cereale]